MIDAMTPAGLIRLCAAVVSSTLPARWRARVSNLPLVSGTWLSGTAEVVVALLCAGRFFLAYRIAHGADPRAAAQLGNAEGFAFGATLYLGFLFSVGGLVCAWLFLEGLLRVVAGIMNEEVGTALLWLIAHASDAARSLLNQPPPPTPWIDDTLVHDGAARTITSCRRRDWDASTTIELDGVFYRVTSADERAGAERPFLYRLEPLPATGAIRKLVRYDPGVDPND